MAILIKCGKLIDGNGGPPIHDALIVVEGEKITAVGRAEEVKAPTGANVIDLSQLTVLPGIIDCHTHLMAHFGEDPNEKYPQPDLYAMLKCVRNMRWDIRCGLTTVRNPSEKSFRAVAVRHAINQGLIVGPRILTGVRGIRPTHGWGQNAFGFDGVESLRKAIRENIEAGADLIKIYVTGEAFADTATISYFNREEVQLCVEETHRVGLKIAAHAHGGEGLRYCLEAGVDTIEHGTMTSEQDIELFIKHGNTLIASFNPYMHETTLTPGRPPEYVAGVIKAQENMKRVFPKAFKSGMKFSFGSDARHGNFIFELEMGVQMGLSPMEAIVACTRKAAETLGILDKTGTLEPGKWADIVAVPKDPLVNISNLREVTFVMKGGGHLDLSPL
jgi:imidazolonepropionase-like amidohydrolase